MCGVAGWIDYRRDLTLEQSVTQDMGDALAHRGPDEGSRWADARAALMVRRLAVIDMAGGSQPMVAEDGGRPVAVLAYTGEIFNFRELAEELRGCGHRFHTASDTEVVLRAYLEWGERCPEHFNGMFAFAVWDLRDESLFLARDRVGIYPLYYHPTDEGVLFGSEPKAILANPSVSPVVRTDGLRELLSLAKTPGAAVFSGMSELQPAHTMRVSRQGMTRRRYWGLEAAEHGDDLPTTIGVVREILQDAVTRQMVSDVPLCSLLSGGLDSCILTAIGVHAAERAGTGPLHSFSVDFEGYAQRFQPDEMRRTPDAPFADAAARHLGTMHHRIVLSTADLVDPAAREAVLRSRDLPTPLQDMYTSLYLLSRAVREHSTVAISGDGADELFGGYAWFHHPRYYEMDAFPWVAVSRHMQALPLATGLLNPGLVAGLAVEEYESDRYVDALAEVPHLLGEHGRDRRMREVTYLNLTRYLQIILDRKDRMAMAVALEGRVPFCDHRLLEYVFNVPWAMKSFDGRPKSLLRAVAVDLLPESLLARHKTPYPATRDRMYREALLGHLSKLLSDETSPVRPLMDVGKASAIVDRASDPMSQGVSRSSIEVVLQLDQWMRLYDIRLELEGVSA